MHAAVTAVGKDPGHRWARILGLAAVGLLAGAVVGFVGALLRPRSWVQYVEPRMASGS
jgi:hypothetical protein